MFDTPVLLLIFNRPDTTRQVFEAIRRAQPRQLFVAADGPRVHRAADADPCRQAREVVAGVDWNCEVNTLFRDANLGCGKAVSEAINWFFTQVEEGIILEDDTVPDQSFFPYCAQLLDRYREHSQVMHISGTNFQFGRKRGPASYYFSNYFHVWGWATWRRAWRRYDFEMAGWEALLAEDGLKKTVATESEYTYWRQVFTNVKKGLVDTWDYQWLFSIWASGGLCVTPNVNLVSNIGAGDQATHTTADNGLFGLPTGSITPLVHPARVQPHRQADGFTYRRAVNPQPGLLAQVKNQLSTLLPASAKQAIKKMI